MSHPNPMHEAAEAVRAGQRVDPTFGGLYTALYTFAERTMDLWFSDCPAMTLPLIGFQRVKTSCRGSYQERDGMMLCHVIVIDPYKCRTGEDAAEVLVHEMVHQWQAYVGRLPERNYHGEEFHLRLAMMGIISSGAAGYHDRTDIVWHEWLAENDDLLLHEYKLPYEPEVDQ